MVTGWYVQSWWQEQHTSLVVESDKTWSGPLKKPLLPLSIWWIVYAPRSHKSVVTGWSKKKKQISTNQSCPSQSIVNMKWPLSPSRMPASVSVVFTASIIYLAYHLLGIHLLLLTPLDQWFQNYENLMWMGGIRTEWQVFLFLCRGSGWWHTRNVAWKTMRQQPDKIWKLLETI